MRPTVHLIDASIYIFRAWFAIPPGAVSATGMPTHAVAGFAGSLAAMIEQSREGKFLAAFDESLGTCFRHAIHPGYKQRRALPDPELAFQLSACRELAEALGISCVASPRYEADDLLASAARYARASGHRCVVLSRDKDLGQLLCVADDVLWDFPKAEPQDRAGWMALQGIRPEQLAARLALTGDSIDDIPGVPGIGERTAVSLLGQYEDVENILADLPGIAASGRRGAARIAASLDAHAPQLRMARQLTQLAEDALLAPPQFHRAAVDPGRLDSLGRHLGFGERLRQRLHRLTEGSA